MVRYNNIFLCLITILFTCESFSMEDSKYLALYEIADNVCPTKNQPDIKSKYLDIYQQANSVYLNAKLEELQKAYDETKAIEQSKANRMLTALSVAAAGIGGMELAMGLAEQQADKEADQNMTAYIETMRCTYGDNKQVKAGPDEIELPGANNSELMSLRNEYFALANDLKERKEALGMKPGIESEEIIDKAQTGLYDDESLSIESGAYASLYRAQMLGSEADQAKIDEERKASKNRVIAGGVLVGAGVVGGMIGDAIINKKQSKADTKELAESTTKLSLSSAELLKQNRTGTVLSTTDTNELLKAIQDKFK